MKQFRIYDEVKQGLKVVASENEYKAIQKQNVDILFNGKKFFTFRDKAGNAYRTKDEARAIHENEVAKLDFSKGGIPDVPDYLVYIVDGKEIKRPFFQIQNA